MPTLNIINLNTGDTQEVLVSKINQNFDSIVANGGGPQGQDGPQGDQGPVGTAGPKGDQGVPGERGTRWFVDLTEPQGGTAGVGIIYGDYWVNTSSNNELYIYATAGWESTGDFLEAQDVFTTITSVVGPGGVTTKSAIVQSSLNPQNNTLVLSDGVLTSGSVGNANPNYSKFLIATDSTNGFPLLEFAKSNLATGSSSDYTKHPYFSWKNPSGSDYGIRFIVPLDLLDMISGGNFNITSTSGNVNFSGITTNLTSTSSMTLTSSGTFNINSGSSNLIVTSNQFSLSSSSAFFSVPVSLSGAFVGTSMFSVENTSTGGGINVNLLGSASTSRYLANFSSNSVSKFYVRSDGKVKFDKTNFAYSVYNSSSPTYTSSSINYYIIGSDVLTNGNRVVVNLTAGASGIGIGVPLNSGVSGLADYVEVGESITMNVFSSSTSSSGWISAISFSTDGSTLAAGCTPAVFSSSTPSLAITVLRTGSSTWLIYYDTATTSGIFSV
jgi:hypothetical protein